MINETPDTRTRLRTILVFAMLFSVLGCVALFAYYSTFLRPVTTVIVVRHAEKNIEPTNADPDLSPLGQMRAQELVRMFSDSGVNAIFATQFKRTQQTLKPLADRLGLAVNVVDAKKTQDLVNQIVTAHRGQTVVVAGHNNTAPEIVAALGGGNFPVIPETEFDNMFIVTIYRFGHAKVLKVKYGNASPAGGGEGTMLPK